MLFDYLENGSVELQKIVGNFPASTNFSAIATEIRDAELAVASIVSKEVVSKASDMYEAGETDGLVAAVRLPVALLAYSRYSKGNLVVHDERGVRIVVDENDKIPFEWMIDRDERAQRERYYRAMDALYSYLEENSVQEWLDSDIRQTAKSCVVKTLSDFEKVYPLEGSYYVYYMLLNLVMEAQPPLKRMIGAELWELILEEGATNERAAVLVPLCRRWVILSAIITAVRRWSLEVLPLSVARRFAPSYQGNRESRAATRDEMEAYVAGLKSQQEDIRAEIAEALADGENPWEDFDLMPNGDKRNKFFSAQ